MRINGRVDLRLRRFWIEGGADGIRWDGRGRVELTDVTLNNNRGDGIDARSDTGAAALDLYGGVDIAENGGDDGRQGVYLFGPLLRVRGSANAVHHNDAHGIYLAGRGQVDIAGAGEVMRDNAGSGLFIEHLEAGSLPSYAYSVDPTNPLTFARNRNAFRLWTTSNTYLNKLCLRNVAIRGNTDFAFSADGHGNHVEMNGPTCQFPPEAGFTCRPTGGAGCNTIRANVGHNSPIVTAINGARLDVRNVLIEGNSGTSLLSTNLGADTPSASAITLTGSLVRNNTVRDNLFEALHGGIVDIWDSTVFGNTGGFSVSLVGINPGLLQATNTIIDQPQAFLAYEGAEPWNTRYTRVLAQNRTGTPVQSEFLIGRPTYADAYGRLAPQSLGIDYAPAGGGVDLDGNPRDVDTIGRPNTHGPRDLGAFENQTAVFDRIFASGFD